MIFYELSEPWSSISVKLNDAVTHAEISLWQDGGLAGELTVQANAAFDATLSLAGKEVAKVTPTEDGWRLLYMKKPRTVQVISETGEVALWSDIVDACFNKVPLIVKRGA